MNVLEILIIVLVALLVFKPEDMPKVAKHFGSIWQLVNHLKVRLKQTLDEQIKNYWLEENIKKAQQAEQEEQ